ncbi:zinc finger protein 502-like isoform X3 [Homalodisca vitripennis]|uniref:zinc finger protein 502-like isoform X3 n=1 Tax=Homalodisca vitripennis TaxID=197043 RepID=UPI001EE9D738|nr:zinc finger protein 502-like isoform X3 [Homalodisca vitripennis]
MAINFSASFAACLAAGLKVPRQFMYCIAQDTGTPYVLYKDGVERGGGMQLQGAMQWGGPPQDYIQQGSSSSGSPPVSLETPQEQPSLISPVASPYPEHHQQSSLTLQVNGTAQQEDEVNQSVVQQQIVQPQQQQTQQPQQMQQTPLPQQQQTVQVQQQSVQVQQQSVQVQQQAVQVQQQAVQAQQLAVQQLVVQPQQPQQTVQQTQQDHSPNGLLEPDRQCFPMQTDMSQYYSRPHMLSPGSFMSYLKQPGVMLTPLNAVEATSDFANMPDLINQQASMNGKLAKSELRLFKCLTCGKDFKQKSTLLQHERIHTDSRPYGCTECGKRFRQQSHLTQHLRIHANEKPFACVYCERTFRQRAILNQHLRIHSDVSPHLVYKNGQLWPQDMPFPSEKEQGYENSDIQCFSPDGQFPAYFKDAKGMTHGVFGQGKMLPDVIQHGRSAGMPLYVRCPICQKEFKQKSTLLQHGCIHIESRPYPCGECGKRFRQQSHLTQHLRIHTNEKPYTCVYCGRNFRQRTILNQHVRIHTGEKPYKCSQCGKDFRQKAILDQHTRTHQGDRPFCCPMPNCRRRFATDQEVKRHIENHMNPHASKRRVEVKHRVSSPNITVNTVVKPELYFPQCYTTAPMFNHQYTPSPQLQDFKPPPSLPPTPTVVQ